MTNILEKKLIEQYPNVFYRVDVVDNVYVGAVAVAQSYGVGRFEANTVMLGWPNNPEPSADFLTMMRDLLALERSILVIHHKDEKGFGSYKDIHIWWGGIKGNGGLILLVAHLLSVDPRWQGAKIKLFVVVDAEEARPHVEAAYQKILEDVRLQGELCVIVREKRSIEAIMQENSQGADLAIIGLRSPTPSTQTDEFFARYNSILASLPSTILVCSARSFDSEPVLFDQ